MSSATFKETGMCADAYHHKVEYSEDIRKVFAELREQVFASGQYRYSEMQPASIEEALKNAEEDGTASILDLWGISSVHGTGYLSPLSDAELEEYRGSQQPGEEQVMNSHDFWNSIGRMEARYLTLYADGQPGAIFIAGFSAD